MQGAHDLPGSGATGYLPTNALNGREALSFATFDPFFMLPGHWQVRLPATARGRAFVSGSRPRARALSPPPRRSRCSESARRRQCECGLANLNPESSRPGPRPPRKVVTHGRATVFSRVHPMSPQPGPATAPSVAVTVALAAILPTVARASLGRHGGTLGPPARLACHSADRDQRTLFKAQSETNPQHFCPGLPAVPLIIKCRENSFFLVYSGSLT
jgi:hypothetical protein